MAAPIFKDIPNLEGIWSLLLIAIQQGVPWVVRKALKYASLSLNISQTTSIPDLSEKHADDVGGNKTPVTTLHVKQTVSPGNFDSEGSYSVNGEAKEYSLPIFGNVSMQLRYMDAMEISDEVLQQKLFEGSSSKTVIDELAQNSTKGWNARVIWGFEVIDGRRYLTRNVVTSKNEKSVNVRMVYDFHD
ncbi:hypothetical protein N7450_000037 [Penicillium hetheringtonii]|uniref:Uncharacterized protein n=1 Tax=Penicillium hetheringtonii TaxID=911720 RepID=A0AAD6E1K7_9EURO|nr:hypothetical protein N7450_000037 [Penicillium hetheringtonii]